MRANALNDMMNDIERGSCTAVGRGAEPRFVGPTVVGPRWAGSEPPKYAQRIYDMIHQTLTVRTGQPALFKISAPRVRRRTRLSNFGYILHVSTGRKHIFRSSLTQRRLRPPILARHRFVAASFDAWSRPSSELVNI